MKKCTHCNSELVEAELDLTYSSVSIKPQPKGKLDFFRSNTSIVTYVCPNCGHIDLFVEDPEIFKSNKH